VRVTAHPWHVVEDEVTREEYPVFLPDITSDTVYFSHKVLEGAFDEALYQRLSAFHEAGHTVVFSAVGLPVDRAAIYSTPERRGSIGRASGHTFLGDPTAPVKSGDYGAGCVAGLVASVMWLEQSTQLNPTRRIVCDLHAADDYEQLLAMDTPEPFALLFGPAVALADLMGPVLDVATLMSTAQQILLANWHAVRAVASHLEQFGSTESTDIVRLITPLTRFSF
jgi:hypothetical protein